MTTPYASEAFIHQLLGKALAAHASDIHLKVGQPPGARVRGDMVYFRVDKIRPEDSEAAARVLLTARPARDQLPTLHEVDTSYSVPGLGRFRVNIYRQRGSLAIVMRSVPLQIPTLDELNLPPPVRSLAEQDRGITLVAGAAGSGKSTTLAAMVGHINGTFARHVVSIEDPIEFLHEDNRSSISQREIGIDTEDFPAGLRAALRQDPDVIMTSAIPDPDSLELAFQAAETGHMVLSAVHTADVARTLARLTSLGRNTVEARERLADALQGIVAQRLLPRRDGNGLVLAMEVLVATQAVRDAIRRPDGNPPLRELMEKGATPFGMQTFDVHLRSLVTQGHLAKEVARIATAI
ncbi:type IV pilus twitching motility protein PilT [Chondromyces apiculatus]|uniref:Twitching motility protein PilT n=1 Tax=Chondromyces apiculatus DSM 436 TaxID=1192034 RepID=A0A017T3Z3_9BACT|nr:PilT/PilU family type 4a pilus ATPase [Chondromyces apiculatus]EYF03712.1 Twitching motility protein PilT [Chondromyces apiculatus DSM 436]